MVTEAKITWDELQALAALQQQEGRVPHDAWERLGDEIVRCEVLLTGGLYRQLLCLRMFQPGDCWLNAEQWLGVKLGWPYSTANQKLRVASALTRLPKIDEAFREGRINYTKVRAIHDVATPENEESLLSQARYVTGAQLKQLVQPLRDSLKREKGSQAAREEGRGVHFFNHPTQDLVEVQATLLPEEAATLRKALAVGVELGIKGTKPAGARGGRSADNAAADLPSQRFGFADALGLIAESFLGDPPRDGVPAGRRELLVHTVPDLSAGLLETGGSLSPEALRRLACDGSTVWVERGEEGEVLDVGRRTRRISRRLERALVIRDRSCRFPGCRRTILLDAHHVEHWVDGGATKLGNLVRLCRTHHRLVHDGGWTVFHRDDGSLGFKDRSGWEVEAPGRLPEFDAVTAYGALEAECRGRGLDPQSNQLAAGGGGERIPDYGYATSCLAYDCGFDWEPGREDEPPPAIRWLLANPPTLCAATPSSAASPRPSSGSGP